MKKQLHYLWAAMFAAVALPAAAQTADSPQKMVVGENTVTTDPVYLTYTSDKNEIVKVDFVLSWSSNVTATDADGNEVRISPAYNYNPDFSAFMAEAGKTYTIQYAPFSVPFTFNCEVMPVAGGSGASCEDALEMPENGDFLFPCVDYYTPVYAKYTATKSGRLTVAATSNMTVSVGSACGELDIDLDYDYVGGFYNYELQVEEGETVIFAVKASDQIYCTVGVAEIVAGSTCKDAFKAVEGANVLPAAAGTYWYALTAPREASKYALVCSSTADATATVYTGCGYGSTGSYSTLNFRNSVVLAGSDRVIKVEKAEATAADETIDFSFETLKPIEDRDLGEPITAGVAVTTPDVPGTYFYSITAPAGKPSLMVVTSDADGGYYSNLRVYNRSTNSSINGGTPGKEVQGMVQPDETYIVEVYYGDGNEPITFTADFEELRAGALEDYPIEAAFGANEVPDFSPVYYTFKDENGCKVELTTDVIGATLSIYNVTGYSNVTPTLTEKGQEFIADANSTYRITLRKAEGKEDVTGTLTFTQLPFAPGESWQSAIEETAGTVTLPDFPGYVWYTLTADEDGFFTIETDLKYDWGNTFEVYVNSVVPYSGKSLNYDYDTYLYKPFKLGVSKGDVLYVYVKSTLSESGKTVTFGFAEAEAGEVASNPIVLTYDGADTKAVISGEGVSYNSPKWYSIELPAGILDITSESSVGFTVYTPDNLTNYLAWGRYITENCYGVKGLVIEEGTYLLSFTDASNNPTITITVREPGPGESAATAVLVNGAATPVSVEVPELSGIHYWLKLNANPGTLTVLAQEGQYIYFDLKSETDLSKSLVSGSSQYVDGKSVMGFVDYEITEAGVYYIDVNSNYGDATLTFSGSAIEVEEKDFVNVNVEVVDGQAYSYTVANGTESNFSLSLPADWKVESVELNGEATEVAPVYTVVAAGEDMDYVFTVAYDGELVFVDATTGLVELNANMKIGVVEGKVRIENTTAGDEIMVYNLGGMLVGSYKAQSTAVEISLNAGAYVVVVNGNSAAKVVL